MRDVEPLDEPFERPADLDPVAMLEQHLAVGWDYAVEVVVEAPVDQVRRYLSPALGRLEAIDAGHTRLIGSTSNPHWYAEQLAVIPAPFRVVGGVELQHTVATLGRRLLNARPVPCSGGGDDARFSRAVPARVRTGCRIRPSPEAEENEP